MEYDILICYNGIASEAEYVASRLGYEGWSCRYVESNIPIDILLQMIDNCSVFVLLTSVITVDNRNIQAALSYAMAIGRDRLVTSLDPDWDMAIYTLCLRLRRLYDIAKEKSQEEADSEYGETEPSVPTGRRGAIYLVILFIFVVGAVLTYSSIMSRGDFFANRNPAPYETPAPTPSLSELANRGERNAQYEYGHIFMMIGDFERGAYWLAKAAEQNHRDAQLFLGTCYRDGLGVLQDLDMAVYWFNRAGETWYAGTQYAIAWNYNSSFFREGELVPPDFEQAAYWFRKAAEQGHISAQTNLGWMYSDGRGVERDSVQAIYWYRQAAEQGDPHAQHSLGNEHAWGGGTTQSYEQAAYWFRKAAEQDFSFSQVSLGVIYEFGLGVDEDFEEAVYWYRRAAELGNMSGQTNYGVMLYNGRGVEQDYEMAVYWFRQAANQGYQRAAGHLGLMYELGAGVEQCYERAISWYRTSIAEFVVLDWVPARLEQLLELGEHS